MNSLRLRLLAWTSLLLAGSFALLGAGINQSYVAALEAAQREVLDSQVIAVLAATQDENGGLVLPIDMPEPRLNTPGSGLYAKIRRLDESIYWRSVSSLGVDLSPELPLPGAGERVFSRQLGSNGEVLDAISLGIVWNFEDEHEESFVFSVAVSRRGIDEQLSTFRRQLYLAFSFIAVTLLLVTGLLLSWLLRPLGRIAREIESVEAGKRESLSSDYPSELTGVARNVNRLLDSEQKRVERYRQTLANLAHSLKTPLAAAKSLLGARDDDDVGRELDRMQDIVRYQLSRPAAAGGRLTGRGSIAVASEVHELLDGLDKVYRDKRVAAETVIEETLMFHGDRGDFVEMLGNLLDNAYKWCDKRVIVEAEVVDAEDAVRTGLRLTVSDDGPGIPAEQVALALARGKRLDESVPGSGIGLSVVAEIAGLYDGSVEIDRSDSLGGAAVVLSIPPAGRS